MFVKNNILIFEAFIRKCVLEFTSCVSVFKNAIICTI